MGFEKPIYNVCLKLGETWNETIQFFEDDGVTPIDLTGRVPRVQVRSTPESATALLDLTDGSGLTFTPLTGLIEISTATTAITVPADYVWALELGGSENEEVPSGMFRVEPDTVRAP